MTNFQMAKAWRAKAEEIESLSGRSKMALMRAATFRQCADELEAATPARPRKPDPRTKRGRTKPLAPARSPRARTRGEEASPVPTR